MLSAMRWPPLGMVESDCLTKRTLFHPISNSLRGLDQPRWTPPMSATPAYCASLWML
jgi:hypothetical protein